MENIPAAYLDRYSYSFMIGFNGLCFNFKRPFKTIELEWNIKKDEETCIFHKFLKIDYTFEPQNVKGKNDA